jgi:hypothetical protein
MKEDRGYWKICPPPAGTGGGYIESYCQVSPVVKNLLLLSEWVRERYYQGI